MKICISEVTTLPCAFTEDVESFSSGGWKAMEVWLTKLEKHLESASVPDTKKLLEEKQLALVAAAYQGGLLLSQGEQRKAHFDHFKRRLDLCQQLAIPTMLLVADFTQKVDSTSLERAVVSLKQAGQWAAGFDVQLALEFRGGDTFCSCLQTALMLIDQCDEPNVGINLDLFHYYKGSSKPEDFSRLTSQNLKHVQLCDVIGTPRELMTDSDRVMPGEGDFDLKGLLHLIEQTGYSGWYSLELMNPLFWQMKSTQVSELGYSAMSRL